MPKVTKKIVRTLLTLVVLVLASAMGYRVVDRSGNPVLTPLESLPLSSPHQGSDASSTDPFSVPRETPFTVVSVIDGDTIVAEENGQKVTVRLIGIDAPETGKGREAVVECFGKEATDHLRSVLPVGSKVALDTDSSQGLKDKYDRLLAYVMLADHTNVNLLMILDGYAYEYTYDKPYVYVAAFKDAQSTASKEGKGLWALGACGGKRLAP